MPLQKLSVAPGIVSDTTDYSNVNGWFASDHVRFNNGLPEKIKGWEKTYSSMTPLTGVCRKLFQWSGLDGTAFLALPTNSHFFIDRNGMIEDVSPIRRTRTLGNNPLTSVNTESYVIVTDTGHGAVVDDYVTIGAAATFNGLQATEMNATHRILDVLDENRYTIDLTTAASSSGAGGGASVTATYLFRNGADEILYAAGFGSGFFGGASTPDATFNLTSGTAITTATGTNTTVGGIPVTTLTIDFPSAHGAAVGDWIELVGATAIGGLEAAYINRPHEVTAVPDSDTIEVQSLGAPSSSTSGGGGAVICTIYDATTAIGWGEGTDISQDGFSGLWSVDNYGEDIVACARSLTDGSYLGANPLAFSNGDATVTVTHPAHGYTSGQAALLDGATAVAGLTAQQLNGSHVITVLDGDSYTFEADDTADATTSGGGSLVRAMRTTIFYWDNDAGGRLKPLTDLGSDYARKKIPYASTEILTSNTDRKVICFGCNPFDLTLPVDKMLIRWSDSRDPTNFDASDTSTSAGEVRLSSGSYIVTATQTKEEILVWTDTSLFSLVETDPPYHFAVTLVGASFNIIGPNAKIVAGPTAYWMGANGFYQYNGTIAPLPCPIRDLVFNDLNRDRVSQIYAGSNIGNGEVIWFYPSAGAAENDRWVIFNYEEGVWYSGTTMPRTAWIDADIFQYPRAVGADGYLYTHERGWDDGSTNPSSAITAYIESSPIEIEGGDHFMFVKRLLPDLSFLDTDLSLFPEPVVTFQLKTRDFPGGRIGSGNSRSVQRQSGATLVINRFTDQVFTRLRARSMALRVSSDGIGIGWRLGTPRIDVRMDGQR